MKLFVIGCSFTEGQGLKNQSAEAYATKLGKKLKLEYFNYGAIGMSNDYIFRKIFELINSNVITKEDILIIQWTHYMRKELPIIHNGRKWYHTIPNSMHAYEDMIMHDLDGHKFAKGEHLNQNLGDDRIEIESKNKKILEEYILKFINEDYQLNTTTNYINSLYAYLEYFNYNHLHFFGWKQCIIKSVLQNKSNFLKETFATYTNTSTNSYIASHPDKEGHENWSDFLYEKITSKIEIKRKIEKLI